MPLVKSYEGLTQTYPNHKGLIVCCDANSSDDTKDVFLNSPSPIPRVYLSTPPGDNLKIHCLFNLLHFAKRLKAKAIVALDGDLASVKRTWIGRLAEPILSGNASLTVPFYHALKFDTPVTNLLAYPLFRALFGRRLRFPFDTDRAFSWELNDLFLSYDRWPESENYQAAEMTMNLLAIANKARICQSFMATPRVNWQNRPVDPSMCAFFQHITGTFFDFVEAYPELWLKHNRSRPTTVTGTNLVPVTISPRNISPPEIFLNEIKTITRQTSASWEKIFENKNDSLFQEIATASASDISVNTQHWSQIVYESALAYRRLDTTQRKTLLAGLTAVFLGRLLTWLREGKNLTNSQLEAQTEEEARIFEVEKKILVDQWSAR
ncbi:MAG: hypothetical protein LBT62_06905 [Deltaproteobacteria bacterium]|nr:hypothetical protein [Deltaproteobacteria bacterium]